MKITNMETFDKMTKTVLKTGLTIIVVKTMTGVDYNEDRDEDEEHEDSDDDDKGWRRER